MSNYLKIMLASCYVRTVFIAAECNLLAIFVVCSIFCNNSDSIGTLFKRSYCTELSRVTLSHENINSVLSV